MQYAGAEGLIVWLVIVVISVIFRAIKASGGTPAMPPKQNVPRPPRQNQGGQGMVQRPIPTVPRPVPIAPRSLPAVSNQPQLSQQELERAHQALQGELEKVFAQVPLTPEMPSQGQKAEKHHQKGAHHEHQTRHEGIRNAAVKSAKGAGQVAYVQGLVSENASQKRLRLRQAYLLTELIGRPRAYDI